jgi:hypothetical protein
MNRYLLLLCYLLALLLLSACMITPLAPNETPTPETPLQPTFTPTTAVTETIPSTATTVVTIAITPTEPLTTTNGTGSATGVTTSAALTVIHLIDAVLSPPTQ